MSLKIIDFYVHSADCFIGEKINQKLHQSTLNEIFDESRNRAMKVGARIFLSNWFKYSLENVRMSVRPKNQRTREREV